MPCETVSPVAACTRETAKSSCHYKGVRVEPLASQDRGPFTVAFSGTILTHHPEECHMILTPHPCIESGAMLWCPGVPWGMRSCVTVTAS